jgi:hypothetical protein
LIFVPPDYEYAKDLKVRYKYRNITSTNAVDCGIIIAGKYGTLNEFTLLYDLLKPIGVLTGTGGIADELKALTDKVVKDPHPEIVFSDSAIDLVMRLENCFKQLKR